MILVLQMALMEPLMCRMMYWHFDRIAFKFLGEDVAVTEVMKDAAIWLMRYHGEMFMLCLQEPSCL